MRSAREVSVGDVLWLTVVMACFVATGGLVVMCDRLLAREPGGPREIQR